MGNGELILVVDDEAAVREVAKNVLETFGYLALVASDGAEAMAIYSERRDEIQVVVTDLMMPVMDGPARTFIRQTDLLKRSAYAEPRPRKSRTACGRALLHINDLASVNEVKARLALS